MVFLAIKDGKIISHADKGEMKRLDGIAKPDKQVTDEEWEAAGSIAHIANGKIVLGVTDAEKQAELNAARLAQIDRELNEIDSKKIRPTSAITRALGQGNTPANADVTKLENLEQQASTLRDERISLQSS